MRPSWHVDAKWLAALAAVFLVLAASAVYTAYRLTEHDTATGAFTAIAVSLLEERVDAGEWERIRAEAEANPEAEYYVPGVNVTLTGAEIARSTLPQALELVMSRVADKLYYEGSEPPRPCSPRSRARTPARSAAVSPAPRRRSAASTRARSPSSRRTATSSCGPSCSHWPSARCCR